MTLYKTSDIGSLTVIKTGKLDANAKVENGQYPFFTCSKEPLRIDKYSFDGEYILVAGNGDLNVKHYLGRFDAYQRTYAIKADESKLKPKYLFYFLSKYVEVLRNQSIGGVIKYIKIGNLTEARIPLPPLAEQQKIAAILDAADTLRQKNQQLVERYTALSKSLFLEMFGDPVTNPIGWKKGTIRDLVSSANYGTSAKAEENGIYPYLRMNNITFDGYMDLTSLKYINLDEKDKTKYLARKGDVLFNRTNSKELVGKTAIYNQETEMAIAGYLIRLRVNDRANPYFIWGCLNSKHGKATLAHMCKSIVGMANINAQELQNIECFLPPIGLQNEFAERLQVIEAQKQQAQRSLEKSEALFNSLLQLAFTGELTSKIAA